MLKRYNPNLPPSGGWFFRESDNSIQRAGSLKRVIEKVIAYRARNRMAPGNPVEEVNAQLCIRQPATCGNPSNPAAVVKPEMPFKARVLSWFHTIQQSQARGPLAYVSDAESRARAEICAVCPLNTPTGAATCGSCKQAVETYQSAILGPARWRDKRLGGCKVLTCDLPTAVHLDEIRVENSALPSHCWRKVAI